MSLYYLFSSSLHIFQKFLFFVFSGLLFLFLFSGSVFANSDAAIDASSSTGNSGATNQSSTTGDSGSTQKNNVIRIREAFPGQSNVIDVSTSKGSIDILSEYISGVFRFVAALSVIIGVIVLMAAGFKIMMAGGDTSARDDAKEWIGKVFMGLAFLFLSGLFLKTINPHFYVFGGGNDTRSGTTTQEMETSNNNEGYVLDAYGTPIDGGRL